MLKPILAGSAALAMFALLAGPGVAAQESPPEKWVPMAKWTPGEKVRFQVQQVVKERAGGKEETKFLSNGTLELTAGEVTADSVRFTWHRQMENGELELVREPWGVRGNVPFEKLLISTIRDGLPLAVRLNLRTHRAVIENRDELAAIVRRRLTTVGGEFSGNLTGRSRAALPEERNTREPSKAALGIQQPLVRHDATRYANTPRNGHAVAAWYARIAQAEIEDFLGLLGREYGLDTGTPPATGAVRTFRPAGAGDVLLTLASAAAPTESTAPPTDENELEGQPRELGLSGGTLLPVAYEAKIEISVATGWPKRAAILRTETDGNTADAKRTTLRRVYLRQ